MGSENTSDSESRGRLSCMVPSKSKMLANRTPAIQGIIIIQLQSHDYCHYLVSYCFTIFKDGDSDVIYTTYKSVQCIRWHELKGECTVDTVDQIYVYRQRCTHNCIALWLEFLCEHKVRSVLKRCSS